VVTVYDFMYERYRSGPARLIHSRQKRRSLERADIISCISSFTRDEVLEFCPSVDPARLQVVPLGVDTDQFYPDPQRIDSQLASAVLFVGMRRGYKQFNLAVQALRMLPQLELGVVGDKVDVVERTMLDRYLPNRWREFGAVPTQRLRQLYSSVYALILPSDCEGFGLPVLEAMACGCPVVAANRASLPEVGGSAGIYAWEQRPEAYSEALATLESNAQRSQSAEAGLARVRCFSWSKTIRLTKELYEP
jgi:mannosyltransferase